jgi:hypothetical protein
VIEPSVGGPAPIEGRPGRERACLAAILLGGLALRLLGRRDQQHGVDREIVADRHELPAPEDAQVDRRVAERDQKDPAKPGRAEDQPAEHDGVQRDPEGEGEGRR